MIDRLLDYYQRELSFVRQMGNEFAAKHPKIAGRLRIDADAVEDPHVSRFVEATALLAARTRLKIDDQFPQICQAVLNTLYPHYLAPFPPTAIVELAISDLSIERTEPLVVAKHSKIETESIGGEPCRFRTCFATELYPIEISTVDYLVPPMPIESSPWNRDVQSAIRIRLSAPSSKCKIEKLKMNKLRLYLGGSTACSNELIHAILGQSLGVAITDGTKTHFMPADRLAQVGFAENESLLPHNPRGQSAYRVLSEFFAANAKFRFVDFHVDPGVWNTFKDPAYIDLVVFLSRSHPLLMRELNKDVIRLGCTPMVNLFFRRAEPIRQTANQTEYRIIPSSRNNNSLEIYSVDRVTSLSSAGRETYFLPFYHPHHASETNSYWYARRDRAMGNVSDDDRGTELYISTTDLSGLAGTEDTRTLDIEMTCLNRDFVALLPFGGGQPRLQLTDAGGFVAAKCVTPPTPTLRMDDDSEMHWRLISHLSLNHVSLASSEMGADALREILRLYNPEADGENRKAIDAIISVSYKRSTARVTDDNGVSLCRGIDVLIVLDSERLAGTGEYLFATILERFFALYCSINSFTRVTVRSRENNTIILAGKPRSGSQQLV